MWQILCDVFVSSVDVLINSLTVTRNAQFIIALRKSVPERVADEVVNRSEERRVGKECVGAW